VYLSKEQILSRVDQKTLYEYYFGQKIDLRRNKYRNPFRVDMRPGSCHFNWYNKKLYFFDKATGDSIDVFSFVSRLYNLDFYQTLYKINLDFSLGFESDIIFDDITANKQRGIPEIKYYPSHNRKFEFKVETRWWDQIDANYWKSYYISSKDLTRFNVFPVSKYYKNYSGVNFKLKYEYTDPNDPCYCYRFNNNDSIEVKMYRPTVRDTSLKWDTNCSVDVIQGYNQLPDTGDTLILSSSLKDTICFTNAGYHSCSTQSENTYLKPEKVRELKSRFDRIVIILDNDSAGINFSKKMSHVYQLPYFILPHVDDCSDFSDIVKEVGMTDAKEIIDFTLRDL
jgi:hypothetical protein